VGDLRNRIKEIKVQLAAANVEAAAINAQQELLEQVGAEPMGGGGGGLRGECVLLVRTFSSICPK
jgi:hypothetical protein